MAKFSIILTTYNHKKFIDQAIDSVLAQTHRDRELLIGDDSPNNETWERILPYLKDPRIKARHHKSNKGIVDNMIFLLSKIDSNSIYVSFLEGDDFYHQDFLTKKKKIFEKNKEIALVYNDLSIIDNKGKIIERHHLGKLTKYFIKNQKIRKRDFLCYGPRYMSRSTLTVRKKIISQIGGIQNYGNKMYDVSDRDFFGRVARTHNVYGIDQDLVFYRIHNDNFTGKSNFLENQKITIETYLNRGMISRKECNLGKANLSINKAFDFLKNGKHFKALKIFLIILLKHPIFLMKKIYQKKSFLLKFFLKSKLQ